MSETGTDPDDGSTSEESSAGGQGEPATKTAVCFDLDNTILSYDRPYDAIVREGLDGHVDPVTEAAIEEVVATLLAGLEALDDDPYRAAVAAAVDAGDPDENAADEMAGGDPAVDLDALRESLRTAELEGTSVSDSARSSLETLAADEDVVVCLLTDGHRDWQRRKLDYHGVADHFEHVVTSYDAGGTKASGAAYDHLRELVDAEEYVMIGDDYEADVEAARAAGFVPIHYERTDGPDFFATLEAML